MTFCKKIFSHKYTEFMHYQIKVEVKKLILFLKIKINTKCVDVIQPFDKI